MTGRGFLIRFIDIGLIVLFGFLLISDIENLSQVELASAASLPESDSSIEKSFLLIDISAEGLFAIREPSTDSVLVEGIRRASDLENRLLLAAAAYSTGRELHRAAHRGRYGCM